MQVHASAHAQPRERYQAAPIKQNTEQRAGDGPRARSLQRIRVTLAKERLGFYSGSDGSRVARTERLNDASERAKHAGRD